jgi:hypothetical protein
MMLNCKSYAVRHLTWVEIEHEIFVSSLKGRDIIVLARGYPYLIPDGIG